MRRRATPAGRQRCFGGAGAQTRAAEETGLFPLRILREGEAGMPDASPIPMRRKTLQTPRKVRWMQAKKRMAPCRAHAA